MKEHSSNLLSGLLRTLGVEPYQGGLLISMPLPPFLSHNVCFHVLVSLFFAISNSAQT